MEKWGRWEPIKGIPPVLYNEFFIDNDQGITIGFKEEADEKRVILNFDAGVLSYKNTDEGSLLKILDYLSQRYDGSFYGDWTLFKVKNSRYLKWFLEESFGVYELHPVEHYVFLTPNDVIEILSLYEPSIIIKEKNHVTARFIYEKEL